MKKMLKNIRSYFRHPWFKIMDPLEKALRKNELAVDRCDEWAMVHAFLKSNDPIRAYITYHDGNLIWRLDSSPGYNRDFCQTIFNNAAIDNGIGEIFKKTQELFPDSEGKLHHTERKKIDFEKIGKSIAAALFFSSQVTNKLLPVLKTHSKRRKQYENDIEKSKKELERFDIKCKNRIKILINKHNLSGES